MNRLVSIRTHADVPRIVRREIRQASYSIEYSEYGVLTIVRGIPAVSMETLREWMPSAEIEVLSWV